MRARHVIAVLAGFLFIIGLLLALDLPYTIWRLDFHAVDWGHTLLSLGADVFLVYIVVEVLLLRDERRYWNSVQGKVKDLIDGEFLLLFTDLALLFPRMLRFLSSSENPGEEILTEMRNLMGNRSELEKAVDPDLFKGGYSQVFSDRGRSLGNLQLRYSFRFLEPELVSVMIDLENVFKDLSSSVSAVANNPFHERDLRSFVFFNMEQLLRVLVQAVDAGVVKKPSFPSLEI